MRRSASTRVLASIASHPRSFDVPRKANDGQPDADEAPDDALRRLFARNETDRHNAAEPSGWPEPARVRASAISTSNEGAKALLESIRPVSIWSRSVPDIPPRREHARDQHQDPGANLHASEPRDWFDQSREKHAQVQERGDPQQHPVPTCQHTHSHTICVTIATEQTVIYRAGLSSAATGIHTSVATVFSTGM